MRMRMLGLVAVGAAPAAAADFAIAFKWCGRSSEITLSGVPKGTKTLAAEMTDRWVPSYDHGGGKIAYGGQKTIPCGAISNFRGPSPPPPQIHDYTWTVKALDAAGTVLATAQATRKFPEK